MQRKDISCHQHYWLAYHCLVPGVCYVSALQWRHNGRDGVSNHQRLHCLLNCWFSRRLKKTKKHQTPRHWPLRGAQMAGEFPAQNASYAEIVSTWCRHHGLWLVLVIRCIRCTIFCVSQYCMIGVFAPKYLIRTMRENVIKITIPIHFKEL